MLELFDLPAHTLFVHAPVVLIPLVSAGAAAIAVKDEWRQRFGMLVFLGSLVTLVATLFAVSSGHAFDEFLDGAVPTARHEELGEQTRILVFVLVALIAIVVFWGRRRDREAGASRRLMLALAALTIAVASAATVWVVMTGHEGARITWTGIFPDEPGG